MKSAKEIIIPAVFTAMLIGVQLVLSGVAGVELVTVLLLTFTYVFGLKQGFIVANAFSILRCALFGFFVNVVLLYLIYFNLFVLVIGLLGKAFKRGYSLKIHIVLTVVAVVLTACFTLIDDIITPLMYSYSLYATKIYFTASLTIMIPQMICALATVTLLFFPLYKVLNLAKK
jgi:hypothetical protein